MSGRLKFWDGTAWQYPNSGPPGMVLLDRVVLGADAPEIDLAPIAGFSHLRILAELRGTVGAALDNVYMEFNGDSAGNYDHSSLLADDSGGATSEFGAYGSGGALVGFMPAASATAGRAGMFDILIPDYAGVTWSKSFLVQNGAASGVSAGTIQLVQQAGVWRPTASAITAIKLYAGNPDFLAGSNADLYGLE